MPHDCGRILAGMFLILWLSNGLLPIPSISGILYDISFYLLEATLRSRVLVLLNYIHLLKESFIYLVVFTTANFLVLSCSGLSSSLEEPLTINLLATVVLAVAHFSKASSDKRIFSMSNFDLVRVQGLFSCMYRMNIN